MNQIAIIPQRGDKGMHVEILQQQLNSLYFDVGTIDGDFGGKTETAVKAFQLSKKIASTGIIDEQTLHNLGLQLKTKIDPNFINAITDLVDLSGISRVFWENGNRGHAPYGYYYGMALTFARLYERLKNEDPIVKELGKSLGDEKLDALKKWNSFFISQGMDNSRSAVDRLRHLLVLMFGLGMMESSGRHCCGWDRGKVSGWNHYTAPINPTSNNSEAGLFQTSYDILNSVGTTTKMMLVQIFTNYRAFTQSEFLDYFSKGAKCSPQDEENYGDGEGRTFQELSKKYPEFALEFTAIALRNNASHWNPVLKIGDKEKGLQIKKSCNDLLKQVQQYIDQYGFKGTSTTPKNQLPETVKIDDDPKVLALNLAAKIGQKKPLERLFNFASDSKANYWAVVDFNLPSSKERFFIFDLRNATYKSYLVTHGKNSGELYAKEFSNEVGSNKSSLGIYKTDSTYTGKHGRSLYLDGLEKTNFSVRERYIVIHKADYVVPDFEGTGRAGRSDGCLAVNPTVIKEVIDCLQDGSLIIAWHF